MMMSAGLKFGGGPWAKSSFYGFLDFDVGAFWLVGLPLLFLRMEVRREHKSKFNLVELGWRKIVRIKSATSFGFHFLVGALRLP